MVTYPGFIEFEHGVPKMTLMTPGAVAMVAGDALTGARLIRETAASLFGTSPLVGQIAKQLAMSYEAVRHQRLESQVLSPRGLNLQTFYQAHASLNGQITVLIDQTMTQFDLTLEVLLAGIDPTGAHIHSVHNPGRADLQHDVIGYGAIGSGAVHVLQAMIGFGHTSADGLKETVYRAYAAKRRAESAPGVGSGTDMAIISTTGVHQLADNQLGELERVYQEIERQIHGDLRERLGSLTLDGTPMSVVNGDGAANNDDDTTS